MISMHVGVGTFSSNSLLDHLRQREFLAESKRVRLSRVLEWGFRNSQMSMTLIARAPSSDGIPIQDSRCDYTEEMRRAGSSRKGKRASRSFGAKS